MPGAFHLFSSSSSHNDDDAVLQIFSDIPFFCVGSTAFGLFVVIIFIKKSISLISTYLYISSLLVFIAAILDVTQLLLRELNSKRKSSSLSGFTNAREVFLALSVGFLYLFTWKYVAQCPRSESPVTEAGVGHSASWSRWGILGKTLQWITLAASFCIPILQLLWRLLPNTKQGGIYAAEATLEAVISLIFILKIFLNIFLSPASSWWFPFKSYMAPIVALVISASLGIGNLACVEFSEMCAGRFLRGVEIYIWITHNLLVVLHESKATFQPTQPDPVFDSHTSAISPKISDPERNFGLPRSIKPPPLDFEKFLPPVPDPISIPEISQPAQPVPQQSLTSPLDNKSDRKDDSLERRANLQTRLVFIPEGGKVDLVHVDDPPLSSLSYNDHDKPITNFPSTRDSRTSDDIAWSNTELRQASSIRDSQNPYQVISSQQSELEKSISMLKRFSPSQRLNVSMPSSISLASLDTQEISDAISRRSDRPISPTPSIRNENLSNNSSNCSTSRSPFPPQSMLRNIRPVPKLLPSVLQFVPIAEKDITSGRERSITPDPDDAIRYPDSSFIEDYMNQHGTI